MLETHSPRDRRRLIDAMRTIEALLASAAPAEEPCVLRGPGPGDLGHIVARHGVLYARECGFDEGFEATVAEIAASFLRGHDPQRERLWLAEIAGRIMGSVMIVRESEDVARLRLFLVEPEARGRGVGRLLLDECLRFTRRKGYRSVVLSTVRRLETARRLYERAGFRKIREAPARRWSQDLIDEEWQLELEDHS